MALACAPEAFAVDGDPVDVAASELMAFSLDDGSVVWRGQGDERSLEADGCMVIAPDGPDAVRVFAPWNFDLRAHRRTGALLSIDDEVEEDHPNPSPSQVPTRVRVEMGLEEIVGRWPDGRVAWRLVVEHPFVDEREAVQAGDAIVLVTSGQHVVVVEPGEP